MADVNAGNPLRGPEKQGSGLQNTAREGYARAMKTEHTARTPAGPGWPAPDSRLQWVEGMHQVGRDAWDSLGWPADTPFLAHDWLRLLEDSGSVGPGTGWTPMHLLARRGDRLAGAAALYRKDHSEGEFVFDHSLARLADQAGIPYYPKLVGMSPFSPAGRYGFAVAPGEEASVLGRAMLDEVLAGAGAGGLGAVQCNYVDPVWADPSGADPPGADQDLAEGPPPTAGPWLRERGFMAWRHQSYLWRDRGWGDFDAFLASLRHGPRRNIRRERAAVRRAGLDVRMVTGDEAPEAWFALMHGYYAATNARFGPWQCKWLTEDFFRGLAGSPRRHLAFAAALRPGRSEPVALSMFVMGGDTLYGRYWGAAEHVPLLHFECCYYAPMQWALERGIRRFDPGIGSEHKARRGFIAVPNLSVHRPADPGLRALLAMHEDEINAAEAAWLDELNALGAYRRDPGEGDPSGHSLDTGPGGT